MLVFEGARRPVEALAFHPDGRRLAVAGGRFYGTTFWDAATGARLGERPVNSSGRPDNIRFDPSGRWLFVAGSDEGLFAIEVATGEAARVGDCEGVDHVAVSPTGDAVVAYDPFARALVCFGLTTKGLGKRRWTQSLRGRTVAASWSVGGLAFHADGKRFVTVEFRRPAGEAETSLRTRAAKDGRILSETGCACERGASLAVSPDGVWAAFASSSHLLAYHATRPAESVKLSSPNRKHLTGLAFHPTAPYLAVTGNDATVRLHDLKAHFLPVARTFDWNIGKLKSVAFNADGSLAAAGGDAGKVVVWDVDV